MSEQTKVGTVGWIDLTVKNCPQVRDFYQAVVGWDVEPVDMGGYQDFNLVPPAGGDAVAGICNARGENASMPPQWLIYIHVEDLDVSIAKCLALGGRIVVRPRGLGTFGTVCVIQDPAGAVAALVTPPPD
jgi:predicted enzyme related to lactoylglutathione lyase